MEWMSLTASRRFNSATERLVPWHSSTRPSFQVPTSQDSRVKPCHWGSHTQGNQATRSKRYGLRVSLAAACFRLAASWTMESGLCPLTSSKAFPSTCPMTGREPSRCHYRPRRKAPFLNRTLTPTAWPGGRRSAWATQATHGVRPAEKSPKKATRAVASSEWIWAHKPRSTTRSPSTWTPTPGRRSTMGLASCLALKTPTTTTRRVGMITRPTTRASRLTRTSI